MGGVSELDDIADRLQAAMIRSMKEWPEPITKENFQEALIAAAKASKSILEEWQQSSERKAEFARGIRLAEKASIREKRFARSHKTGQGYKAI